jgi:hypothetical protein
VKNFGVAEEISFSRRNLLREVKRDGLNDDLGTVSRRLSRRFKGNPTVLLGPEDNYENPQSGACV